MQCGEDSGMFNACEYALDRKRNTARQVKLCLNKAGYLMHWQLLTLAVENLSWTAAPSKLQDTPYCAIPCIDQGLGWTSSLRHGHPVGGFLLSQPVLHGDIVCSDGLQGLLVPCLSDTPGRDEVIV